jgi:SWI/SNF-related matrix-associated actin-dependent regulator 1 of chromatin subfamily A
MKISHKDTIFFASSFSYDDRDALKLAGFIFHPGRDKCEQTGSCGACRQGIGRTWWTKRVESAVALVAHADDDAAKVLRAHVAAVAGSRAMDADIDIPCPKNLTYYGYQRAGIKYMAERPATLLADPPGLGKSIEVLGLINLDQTIRNILVICPASLRINWLKEARKWIVPLKTRQFVYHMLDEDEALPSMANFVIASYNRVTIRFSKCVTCAGVGGIPCSKCGGTGEDTDPKYACGLCSGKKTTPCVACDGKGKSPSGNMTVWQSLMKRQWDLLAVDESHMLSNSEAARTKCIIGNLRKEKPGITSRAKKKVFISGTPLPNRPIELWSVLAACAPDIFGNFEFFSRRYCDAHREFVGKRKILNVSGASHLDELQEKLRSTVMIRRNKSEVLAELPPKIRQIIELPVPAEAARLVDEELATFRSKYEDKLDVVREEISLAEESKDDAAYRAAVDKLEYIQRVAFMEMAKVRHLVAVAKLPLCIEHVRNALEGGGKIVLFAHHKDVIKAFESEFKDECVVLFGETGEKERDEAVVAFQNDPKVKLFVGGLLAAGLGLTLTASAHAIFAEQSWVPSHVSQAEDRLHRIGQLEPVLVHHLVWNGSLDAHMVKMLVEKQNIADQALDKQTGMEKKIFGDDIAVEPVPPFEKALLKQAIMLLAQKRGTEAGGGFSTFDQTVGQKLATWHGPWSDRQAHLGRKLVRRYRGQVPAQILVELGITEAIKATRKGPSAVEVLSKGTT